LRLFLEPADHKLLQMKRAATNNAGEEDVPKTQPGFSSPPPSYEEDERYPRSEELDAGDPQEFDWPEDPELGWYLSHWEMTDLAKIAVCRTYANYLSAKQPKNVEAKAGCFSKRRKSINYGK